MPKGELHDIGFGYDFLNMNPKAQATTTKNKWDYIKIQNFCAQKVTISRVKRQLRE